MSDSFQSLVELYALGVLDARETSVFEDHLAQCHDCRDALKANRAVLADLSCPVAPRSAVRDRIMDLSGAPRRPVNLSAYTWDEIAPGVRLHVMNEDRSRGVRAALMWADPGARRPSHRHIGDEEILVLEGSLTIGQGAYTPGDICRVDAGWFHVEEAAKGGNCVCYVVHRTHERGKSFEGAPDPLCVRCIFYPIHSAAFPLLAT